tara:strand:- start:787 stop:1257 length:471 start_codon:yes stop_codon:yes gene_type:complete
MSSLKKNHFKLFILFFILSNCQLQDPKNTHGIIFLENRAKKLIVDESNKNDVLKIVGNPQIRDENNENNWIYLERVLEKGKYHELGKHKLKENNVLVLNFDKYGILKEKEFYKKEDINKVEFSENETKNDLTKKSFLQKFLQSIKQKMYSNRNLEF